MKEINSGAPKVLETASPQASWPESMGVSSGSRRRLIKLGATSVPVIATLASRPVLAAACLSNMMSGNLSNPNRGNCSKGWSPGGWMGPGGVPTPATWTSIGLVYGYLKTGGSASQFADYKNGDKLSNLNSKYPGSNVLNKNGVPTTELIRNVLNPSTWPFGADYQLTRHFICAYLNALLGALPGSTFVYVMTPAQVLGLANSMSVPPGYTDMQTFLGSTWV